MGKEKPSFQINMFTGELDDNRTRRQKKLDQERQQPKQIEMFSQAEVAQFGVKAHPLLPLSDHTKLGLIFEDPRTEEEKDQDRQREAERLTHRMFVDQVPDIPEAKSLAVVVYMPPCLALTVIEEACRAVVPFEGVSRAV